MEIFIIEGDGNQPERSKQGHILRVLTAGEKRFFQNEIYLHPLT